MPTYGQDGDEQQPVMAGCMKDSEQRSVEGFQELFESSISIDFGTAGVLRLFWCSTCYPLAFAGLEP